MDLSQQRDVLIEGIRVLDDVVEPLAHSVAEYSVRLSPKIAETTARMVVRPKLATAELQQSFRWVAESGLLPVGLLQGQLWYVAFISTGLKSLLSFRRSNMYDDLSDLFVHQTRNHFGS